MSDKNKYDNKGSFEYFIGYKIDIGIILLYIKLPQSYGYVKYFDDDNNKCVNFLINDKGLLEKCNTIWNKISNLLKKGSIVNQFMIINTSKLKKNCTKLK